MGVQMKDKKGKKMLSNKPVVIDGIAEIDGEKYYEMSRVREILEVMCSTVSEGYFSSVWNIDAVGNSATGKFYKCHEIDNILKETKEYYEQLYNVSETMELLEIHSLSMLSGYKEAVAEKVILDLKYRYFLRKTYNFGRVAYSKIGIDALVSKGINIVPNDGEIIINGERYYNLTKIMRVLEIRNKNGVIEILEDEWGFVCLNQRGLGASKFFKASDIEKALKETDEYYKELYPVKDIAEILGIDTKKIYNYGVNVFKIDYKYRYLLKYKYETFKTNAVRKRDVEHLIENINNTPKNKTSIEGEYSIDGVNVYIANTRYYRDETVKEKLQTSRLDNKTFEKWNVRSIYVDGKIVGSNAKGSCRLYDAFDIDNIIKEITNFINKLYSLEEVRKMLSRSTIRENLTPVEIPEKYKGFMTKYKLFRKSCYKKEDVDILARAENSTYTLDEIEKMFNRGRVFTKKLLNEYDIKIIKAKKGFICFREEIDNLLAKKKDFSEKYLFGTQIAEYFGKEKHKSYMVKGLEGVEIPSYVLDSSNQNVKMAYRKADVEKRALEYKKNQEILNLSNISGDTYFNTFELRLNAYIDWEEFLPDSEYARKYWISYVKDFLERTSAQRKTANVLINRFVICTPYLKDFLDRTAKKEIYDLTSNEINIVMRSINVLTHFKTIRSFLWYVSSDRISKGLPTNFKVSQIINEDAVFDLSEPDKEANIYSFEDYAKVFDYCTNIKSRIDLSIKEIEKKGTYKYLSTWLYVILHLNNAWRNGNVIDFPRLYVDDILDDNSITTINWFRENIIDIVTARRVVFRVVQKEIEIYKTQVKGAFFCSDELAPAFATAVLMLSLNHRDNVDKEGPIMIFGTQHNEINSNMLNKFFKGLDIQDFQFGSNKFNKTVMTFIYYIANITGDSKALIYAMKLRAHIEASTTTKHYLALDKDNVAALGAQLFKRGEFGYIPTLLAKKLNGGKLNFEETTREVELINQSFGDIVKLNTTVGFMNDMMAKKRSVFDFVDNLTLSEAQEQYTDLYLRNSPSKDSTDILCPFGKKNCKHTEINDCFDCEFHIPTIHAITDLTKRMKIAIEGYKNATSLTEKFRYALSVERKKIVIKEAIAKFGKELVYECLGMNREEFLGALAIVPKKEKLMELGKSSEV